MWFFFQHMKIDRSKWVKISIFPDHIFGQLSEGFDDLCQPFFFISLSWFRKKKRKLALSGNLYIYAYIHTQKFQSHDSMIYMKLINRYFKFEACSAILVCHFFTLSLLYIYIYIHIYIWGWGHSLLKRCSQCILQPQPIAVSNLRTYTL